MTWWQRWWPHRGHETHTDEAREVLAHLRDRDAEVNQLGDELREAQRRNHFSELVTAAIRQHRNRDA